MSYAFLTTATRGHVGIVTLARPERLNGWNGDMHREVKEALEAFDADPQVGAIVWTGSGRAFCAGADVKRFDANAAARARGQALAGPERSTREDEETVVSLIERIKPVVVAYNGYAIGAGLTMSLSADYRIAAEHARLSMRFVAMGLVPELESTRLLPQICGSQHAMDLMLSGAMIDAEQALRMGLVAEVVAAEELLDRAVAKAAEYAHNAPEVTRLIKQVVHANMFEPAAAAVRQREHAAFAEGLRGRAHAEAARAFVEKREADFYRR